MQSHYYFRPIRYCPREQFGIIAPLSLNDIFRHAGTFVKSKLFTILNCTALLGALGVLLSTSFAGENVSGENNHVFQGKIRATLTRDSRPEELLYTFGTNFLRVESAATNGLDPADILNRSSGDLILIFPRNRSFVHVKSAARSSQASGPAKMPQMPPGIGPQSEPRSAVASGMPASAMVPLPPVALEKLELRDTNEKTNLLGYACERFQIRQRGKTMDIWATRQLGAFQPYWRSEPSSGSAGTIEAQWSELLKAGNLFPLVAILKLENGRERLHFEADSVTPQNIGDENAELFQPPVDYHEALPLPF